MVCLVLGIRMGLSAPCRIGHALDLAVRPNELRNVRGAVIGSSAGIKIMPHTRLSMRKPNAGGQN